MNVDFEPTSPSVFAAAVQWLDATLLGSIATAVAVLSVASIGFLLISGRIDVRRAAQIIFGCFILFGASSIAGGIMGSVGAGGALPGTVAAMPAQANLLGATDTPVQAAPYDPYAGAALPARR